MVRLLFTYSVSTVFFLINEYTSYILRHYMGPIMALYGFYMDSLLGHVDREI